VSAVSGPPADPQLPLQVNFIVGIMNREEAKDVGDSHQSVRSSRGSGT
jgi:hypothetical protein